MANETPSPDLMQALAKLGLLPQHLAQATAGVTRGQQMADTPMPQGQVFQPGYQAPHPLQYLSAILRQGQGEKMAQQGNDQTSSLLSEAGNTNRMLAERALSTGRQGQQGQQGLPGMAGPPGMPGEQGTSGAPNIYDLLMGSGPTAQATAQALAEQIRHGREMGVLGALGSPGAANGIGSAMAGNAKQDEEAQLKLMLAMIGANRPQFKVTPDNPDYSGLAWDPATKSWRPVGTPDRAPLPGAGQPGGSGRDLVVISGPGGEQYRYNKMTREIEQIMAPPGAPGTAEPGAPPQPLVKGSPADVAKLSSDLSFVSKMPEDLDYLKSWAGKDVPGMGPVAGLMPDWATSDEGNKARQSAMRLLNALVYMQSGKQINESEMARILVAEGLGPRSSKAAFKAGVTSLEAKLKRATQNFINSRPPGVVELARKQGILQGLEPFLGAAPTSGGPLVKKYVRGPDGKLVEAPQ